jgi:hypothetical protein
MPSTPLPLFLTIGMALVPLGPTQQARLAAWLNWGAAYRDCYEPAPFSLRIDQTFTAHCIEAALRQRRGDSPAQQAATDALIAATPRLIGMLNAPAAPKGVDRKTVPLDPPSPAYR